MISERTMYIRRYTSPSENFKCGYPHSNALLQFLLKLECCKPHNAARYLTKFDVISNIKLFPTYTVAIFDVIQSEVGL